MSLKHYIDTDYLIRCAELVRELDQSINKDLNSRKKIRNDQLNKTQMSLNTSKAIDGDFGSLNESTTMNSARQRTGISSR